ncbi:MAG: hypothetical protein J6T40_07185 [Clostridiales bacterium]|nr:hypothetical protein [Clostridiales bacterium]
MKRLNKHSLTASARGMGTVEVVIIIAILVALALAFRNALTGYASSVMDYVFDEGKVVGQI